MRSTSTRTCHQRECQTCGCCPSLCQPKIMNEIIINIQWGSEIRPFEIRKHLKSGLFEGLISNGPALAIVPTIQKPDHSKSKRFYPDFKCFFGKMAAICPDFKWLGFWILDPIQNPDHLHPKLSSTIQNRTKKCLKS